VYEKETREIERERRRTGERGRVGGGGEREEGVVGERESERKRENWVRGCKRRVG